MTITNPDEELPAKGKGKKKARKQFGTKTLDVIYAEEGKKDAVIVTTYWTQSKPKTFTK